jgi:hypothetical protein
MLPERELQRLTPESGGLSEGTMTRVRMSRGVVDSDVDGRHGAETVQGALSYEFRTGLDVNKEVNGNP